MAAAVRMPNMSVTIVWHTTDLGGSLDSHEGLKPRMTEVNLICQ